MRTPRVTILIGDREVAVDRLNWLDADAQPDPAALWIDEHDLPRINGFEVHAHGACRGDICIPLPAALRHGAHLDLAAFARLCGQPIVADAEAAVWSFGEMPAIAGALASREAPDVVVPDRAGRPVRLAAGRGTKMLVVTWASW
jgi:hypothetical protein